MRKELPLSPAVLHVNQVVQKATECPEAFGSAVGHKCKMVLPILATQRCRGGRYTEQVNKTDPNLLKLDG